MSTQPDRPLTLRAKTQTDLLAMVPCVLGFHPEDSIVLVTLGTGPDLCHARVDLPERAEDVPEAAEQILQVARRGRLGRCVLVVYTSDADLAAAVARTVVDGLDEAGVQLVESIRTDGSRWYSLSCTDSCCPPEGTPYDISDHPFLAQTVFAGRVTLGSRAELAASLRGTDPAAVAVVAEAADRAADRLAGAGRHPLGPPAPERARRYLVGEGRWVQHRVRSFVRDRKPLTDAELGRLLVALRSIEVRDVAWAEMNRADAESHVDLWRDVVRRTPRDLLAPPAALLGFAAWLSGHGALAWCAVDRAHEADPDYSMVGLLAHALAAGVPPSRWEPLGQDELPLFAG